MCHRALKVRYLAIIALICSSVPTAALSEVLISPSITMRESYNSNPLSRSKGQNVDDDYITTVTPQIRVTSKQKDYQLNVSYQMNSTYYHEEPANNDISHLAGAGISADITKRTSISLNDTFRATKDSLSAIDEGIQTSRDDITHNTVNLDIVHRLGPATSLTLDAAFSRSDFDDPALTDTMTDTASMGMNYRLNEKRSTSLTYSFSNYSFDTAGSEKHTETQTLRAGLTEQFSPTLSIELSGGIVYTPNLSDKLDWTARADLAKTLKKTTANLGYKRSVSNSSGLSEEISFNDSVEVGLSHALSESINTAISGALTKSRSKPSGTIDLDSYSAALSVSWRPYPWMTTGIGYSKFKQLSAGVSASTIDRDQVYITLTLTPQQWRL